MAAEVGLADECYGNATYRQSCKRTGLAASNDKRDCRGFNLWFRHTKEHVRQQNGWECDKTMVAKYR